MRKNKGYQKENKYGHGISWACGNKATVEQVREQFDKRVNDTIALVKRSYKRAIRSGLSGSELKKYCRENMLWEVKFDDNLNLIPVEDIIRAIENSRERMFSHHLNGWNAYQKRVTIKDNQKLVYNSGSGGSSRSRIRVPSLKRSNSTWKRFYELFPDYEEMSHDPEYRRIYKLKKL